MKFKLFNLVIVFTFLIILTACKSYMKTDISSYETFNSEPFVMQMELPYGGDLRKEMCTKYKTLFYGADTFLAEIIGEEKFNEWLSEFKNGRNKWECNIYNAVHELNITKEDFVKENKGLTYTPNQIDAIFSDDKNKINKAFVNDYALMVDSKIYTPDWLAVHTISDYEKNNIRIDDLEGYLKKIDIPELRRENLSITATLKIKVFPFDEKLLKDNYYKIDFYCIPDFVHKLVSDDEYERWVSSFIVENNDNVRDMSEFNIINFVRELKIEKSDFVKADKDKIYSNEQINAIFSGNNNEINDVFISKEKPFSTESSSDISSETSSEITSESSSGN